MTSSVTRARSAAVGLTLGAMLVGGGMLLRRALPPRIAGGAVAGQELFAHVADLVRRLYVDSLDADVVYRAAIDGGLRELGDPNTVYLPPDRLAQLRETTSGNYGGVGVEIDIRDEWLTVMAPLRGTPAERAGLQPGDRVVAIDGQGTRGWTVEEASRAVRGAPGTTLLMTIERPGVDVAIPIALKREEIHQQAVRRAIMLGTEVGYVDVDVFSEATARELSAAIETLRRRGALTVILDLRNNPGGLLEQGVATADLFLDAGEKVVGLRGRIADANREISDTTPEPWPDLRLLLLINGGSASSAEIVAGALQDNDRALLVGSTSFGKGSAQSLIGVEGGGALKLTTMRWFTPLGRTISRRTEEADTAEATPSPSPTVRTPLGRTLVGGGGITPDVVVTTAPDPTELSLARALGEHAIQFRDAMTDLARTVRGAGTITSRSFEVTPQMLEDLWRRLGARGIRLDRTTYDRARPVIARALGGEIARFVFGADAEFERAARDDAALQRALELARGAASQADLFARIPAAPSRGRCHARHAVTVFILGAGRVGRGLSRALRAGGVEVIGLHGRRAETGEDRISAGPLPDSIGVATVVLVTVRDTQLPEVLGTLTSTPLAPEAVILHASGASDPAEALAALRAQGHPAGTFHPLVPIPDPAGAGERLRGGWIGTDGDPEAIVAARALATRLGARVLTIPAEQKPLYHAAAVFASNFPVVLAATAMRLFAAAGVQPPVAYAATLSLLSASVENLRDQLLPAALTGPVVRADVDTIRRHLAVLESDPDAAAAYRSLSRIAASVAAEVAHAPAPSPEVLAVLEERATR